MGAETKIYVWVMKTHKEWVEVDAVTLEEARSKAAGLRGVICVLGAQYEEPFWVGHEHGV